jgi:hypothetical protein
MVLMKRLARRKIGIIRTESWGEVKATRGNMAVLRRFARNNSQYSLNILKDRLNLSITQRKPLSQNEIEQIIQSAIAFDKDCGKVAANINYLQKTRELLTTYKKNYFLQMGKDGKKAQKGV